MLSEIDEASNIITSKVDKSANIIYGQSIDERLKDKIKITVIATGFRKNISGISYTKLKMDNSSTDLDDLALLEIPTWARNRRPRL